MTRRVGEPIGDAGVVLDVALDEEVICLMGFVYYEEKMEPLSATTANLFFSMYGASTG